MYDGSSALYEEVTAPSPMFRKGWATSRDFSGRNLLYQERQAEVLPNSSRVRFGLVALTWGHQPKMMILRDITECRVAAKNRPQPPRSG